MIKQSAVVEMIIPRYNEMKANNVWPLVKEINELMIYFSDYEQKHIPDRKFMCSIIDTLRYDELKTMIKGARKNRALKKRRVLIILFTFKMNYTFIKLLKMERF